MAFSDIGRFRSVNWVRTAAAAMLIVCGSGSAMGMPAHAAETGVWGGGGGGEATKPPTIVSTGTATVEREPDYVDVSIGIVAEAKTASEAQKEASKVMDAAIAAMRGLKLAGEDLKTGSVDLSPRYEQRNNYERGESPKIIGYVGTITLRVRTTDLKSPARIIDTALAAGCNRIDGVVFGIKEALEAREEAIRLSVRAAKRKAEVMAEALDMRIVAVLEASTSSPSYGGWRTSNVMSQVAFDAGGGQGESAEIVVPGKIEVVVNSTVTFVAAPK